MFGKAKICVIICAATEHVAPRRNLKIFGELVREELNKNINKNGGSFHKGGARHTTKMSILVTNKHKCVQKVPVHNYVHLIGLIIGCLPKISLLTCLEVPIKFVWLVVLVVGGCGVGLDGEITDRLGLGQAEQKVFKLKDI